VLSSSWVQSDTRLKPIDYFNAEIRSYIIKELVTNLGIADELNIKRLLSSSPSISSRLANNVGTKTFMEAEMNDLRINHLVIATSSYQVVEPL